MANISVYYEDANLEHQTTLAIGNINYPGYSAYRKIVLTNDTAGALTPILSFSSSPSLWSNTLRITETINTVGAHTWTGAIAGGASKTLYVYSDCTVDGFSRRYGSTCWITGVGAEELPGFDSSKVNDGIENVDCWTMTTAGATAFAFLDAQTPQAFAGVRITTDGTAMSGVFDISYFNGTSWVVVATADLSATTQDAITRKTIWYWWTAPTAAQYWKLVKTDGAAASGDVQEVQFLLFDVHDGYDAGVYGSKTATLVDSSTNMADFPITGSVNVVVDIFSRQQADSFPIGKIGQRAEKVRERIQAHGDTIQLYYVPQVTFTNSWNTKNDIQVEARYWNVKAIVSPHQRNLLYKQGVTSGLTAEIWAYDQRQIILDAYGPDFVGWYQLNWDYFHKYGHCLYALIDDVCYKLDDPRPIVVGDEMVSFECRIFTQSDLRNLSVDPRDYMITTFNYYEPNRLPTGTLYVPTAAVDLTTPEQRSSRWTTSVLSKRYARKDPCRPNPYSITATTESAGVYNGEVYDTEEWVNPESSTFTTKYPVFNFLDYKNAVAGIAAYQITRYYNWWGACITTGNGDQVPCVLQCYVDADCLIPISLPAQNNATAAYQYEKYIDVANISATGQATISALGATCVTDGRTIPTPSKVYVRYRWDDGISAYL